VAVRGEGKRETRGVKKPEQSPGLRSGKRADHKTEGKLEHQLFDEVAIKVRYNPRAACTVHAGMILNRRSPVGKQMLESACRECAERR